MDKIIKLIGIGFISTGFTLAVMLKSLIDQQKKVDEFEDIANKAWWKSVEAKATADAYKVELECQRKRLSDLELKNKED